MTGIPYKKGGKDKNGCDCYGLVYLFYKEKLGIIIDDLQDFNKKIDLKKKIEFRKVDKINKNDIGVFKNNDGSVHCVIFLDKDNIFHINEKHNSIIEGFKSSGYFNSLIGIYRHESFL